MNLSQEAELGRSMLLALPEGISNGLIMTFKDKLENKSTGFDLMIRSLQSLDRTFEFGKLYAEPVIGELNDLLGQYGFKDIYTGTQIAAIKSRGTVYVWVSAEADRSFNDFWDPLNRVYLTVTEKDFKFAQFPTYLREDKISSVSRVQWKTPHLAGLSKTHRDDLIVDFRYNQDQRTYELQTVRRIMYEGGVPQLITLGTLELVEVFLVEFFRKERIVRDEGDDFLAFIKNLSQSKEKSDEKYARWSKALLKAYADRTTKK
jgi:hypothetical protein